MILKGRVFDGIGKGAYYVKIYKKEISKLGIDPFYGTLNVYVDKEQKKEFLELLKAIIISGFSVEGKRYGDIVCYRAYDEKGDELLIVIPKETKYKDDVIEIISNHNLREKFNIKKDDVFNILSEKPKR